VNKNNTKKAIIIGAGPAGLTAALELLEKTDIIPVIFEETSQVGGLSRTVDYKGNKIDIGGHRFFSKHDTIMNWWTKILPVREVGEVENHDKSMLVRNRVSRIYFLGKFFDYPISLNLMTLQNLGITRVLKIGSGYLKAKIFPIKNEQNLENFFINRFGKELYNTFFKDYTEKVWGIPCCEINSDWGAQRVKGLSISVAILHFLKSLIKKSSSIMQKDVETSLISKFFYPKFGPGQLWEEVASQIVKKGGEIHLNHQIIGLNTDQNKINEVKILDIVNQKEFLTSAEHFISTMPVKELINCLNYPVPEYIKDISNGLLYRDFITVGLLVKKLKLKNEKSSEIKDNWIYIQDNTLKMGRLQIFNNWSPFMIKDTDKKWLGLEYFCNEGDDLWNMKNDDFIAFAVEELHKTGIIDKKDVVDAVIIKYKKAYPSYFGTYSSFEKIKEFLNNFENLFLIGRNGMHRYNNMDHSMLTAIETVKNIMKSIKTKDNIWNINTEKQYHENKFTAVENLTGDVNKDTYTPDEYWEKTETAYSYYPTVKHRKRFILKAISNIKIHKDTFIFDYGCGNGNILSNIKKKYGMSSEQLGGCDVADNLINKLKAEFNSSNFFAEEFPRLNKKADIIVCSEVIEHTEKYNDIIKWAFQNIKTGGTFILTTQTGKIHASDKYTGHTQHFELKKLLYDLENNGFLIKKAYKWGFPLFTLQKMLTDINFNVVRMQYLEGDMTFSKKIVYKVADILYFAHNLINHGPQIFIIAEKKN